MNLVRLDLDFGAAEHPHGHVDETDDAGIDVVAEAQHHGLGELACTNPVHASNFALDEHVGDHLVQRPHVLLALHKLRRAILNEVVQCGQHVFKIELGT